MYRVGARDPSGRTLRLTLGGRPWTAGGAHPRLGRAALATAGPRKGAPGPPSGAAVAIERQVKPAGAGHHPEPSQAAISTLARAGHIIGRSLVLSCEGAGRSGRPGRCTMSAQHRQETTLFLATRAEFQSRILHHADPRKRRSWAVARLAPPSGACLISGPVLAQFRALGGGVPRRLAPCGHCCLPSPFTDLLGPMTR
jgi:hypothetical protein